jgi:hypothetical protein
MLPATSFFHGRPFHLSRPFLLPSIKAGQGAAMTSHDGMAGMITGNNQNIRIEAKISGTIDPTFFDSNNFFRKLRLLSPQGLSP